MQHRAVRQHLFRVLLIGIFPIGLFAAAMLWLHWREQESQRARIQMETTRLLAVVVDSAIDSSIQRLSILADLWIKDSGQSARLHRHGAVELYQHVVTALSTSPDWENVLAFAVDGTNVFRADRPFGTANPPMRPQPYVLTAIQQNRPTVSTLFDSSVRRQKVVGIAVPVARNGRVGHVLIASLDLGYFDALLRRQGLAPGGIAGAFDADLKFIARSHDGDERRGQSPPAALLEDMRRAAQGMDRYPSLDGTSVYTSWDRTRHGWAVALAQPAEPVAGALRNYLLLFGGLWLLLLAAGLAFATFTGRKITNQILRMLDEARAERDRLLAEERELRAAAESANRAKDEFLAMLGHELRNPLAAISNSITLIRGPQHTPEQLEFASGVIQRQSRHLRRLIDDLLDVGRLMTGKISLRLQPLDLQDCVDHVVSALQAAGTLQRHEVRVSTKPVWISGDPTRIEQILSNLLVNAATYTPEGGSIEVAVNAAGRQVLLSVRDDGTGIAAEAMPRLFDLFFQGERSVSGSGLGIGLTLVKRLVELHGGTIEAESGGPGKGSVFTVRFPALSHPDQRKQ